MKIVLASGSPRRKTLLKKLYNDFDIVTAEIDERSIEDRLLKRFEGAPRPEVTMYICMQLAYEKAKAVFEKLGSPADTLVIGADTSCALPDEILGKPKDRDDAVRMLRKESTYPQFVITGVALIAKGKERKFCTSSKVVFKQLDAQQEERIQRYCDTDEPYDKAGAYGLQDHADTMVDYYEGDFDNIVGLPVSDLRKEIELFIKEG